MIKRTLLWVAGVLNAAAIITSLLYVSVCLPTFSIGFYEAEYDKNGTYAVVDMEATELLAVTEHMLEYMAGDEPELNIETVVGGQRRLFFSEREIAHMADVAGLFAGGRAVLYAALSVLLLTSLLHKLFKTPPRILGVCYIAVPALTIASFSAVGLAFAADFGAAFTAFHQIFFTNDLWLLDPSADLLINIVPTAFFMDLGLIILCIFLAGLAIMVITGVFILKRRKRPKTA